MLLGGHRSEGSRRSRREENTTSTAQLLRNAVSFPEAGHALREHYARRAGGEHIEFLISSSNFERSRNALQRFQQLHHIIHRFVHPDAERPVAIRSERRRQMLDEWKKWSASGHRIPPDAALPGLRAATAEIMAMAESRQAPGRSPMAN
jgi:hypothetical protein